ncbi:MAG: cell division protein FtsZ [Flavobacteriales bacterium]|jgi:cell division protein FtsZ
MDNNMLNGAMRFDLPREQSSIIKVIGVGGGGSNAVNYMYQQGIKGVDFLVCNTDAQALDASPVPIKIQLGSTLTAGRGAGSKPEVGRNAAVENLEDVKAILGDQTTMVFVTAGMGGGTGTGAAPVIARAAREMGILTVGIVTVPFGFEGRRRSHQAQEGLQEMRDAVDTLLVIRNDKLRELFGNLSLKQAFAHADEVLCTAAKGIAEVITLTGEINVDMNDVNTVMRDSGVAIMGSGMASGEGRAENAVRQALESPLLYDNDITGANFVLLNITYGDDEVRMDEISEITDYIQECAGRSAEVIWGYGQDEALGEHLCVTVIATGFSMKAIDSAFAEFEPAQKPVKHVLKMDDAVGKEITAKIDSPTAAQQIPPVVPTRQEPETNEPYIKQVETPAEPKNELPHAPVYPTTPPPLPSVAAEETPQEPEIIRHNLFDEDELPVEHFSNAGVEDHVEEEIEEVRMTFTPESEAPADDAPIFRDLDGNIIDGQTLNTPEQATDSFRFTPQPQPQPQFQPIAQRNDSLTREELTARNQERMQRVSEISNRLRTPSGLTKLEDEPAYMRRNVKLDDQPHSSQSNVSKFTLFGEEDENGNVRAQLREDNSYLNKKVD